MRNLVNVNAMLSWSLKYHFCIFSEWWTHCNHWSRRTLCCWCGVPACCSVQRDPKPYHHDYPCHGHAGRRGRAQHFGHSAVPRSRPGPRCSACWVSSLLSHHNTPPDPLGKNQLGLLHQARNNMVIYYLVASSPWGGCHASERERCGRTAHST